MNWVYDVMWALSGFVWGWLAKDVAVTWQESRAKVRQAREDAAARIAEAKADTEAQIAEAEARVAAARQGTRLVAEPGPELVFPGKPTVVDARTWAELQAFLAELQASIDEMQRKKESE